ncbi:MAG: ribosome-associated translation inhibitor RaiA [Pseudomonadota bacterium]|nr:ribosome-associated translation inhibitor RaiA [Pseudomonadota bacterium]
MQSELQISYRDITPSPAIQAAVQAKIDKLERLFDGIIGCRVMIEAPHQHHHKGKIYHIRIDLTVPGAELVVNRDPGAHHAHEDIYVAIRDAFNAMNRQLEDYARKLRGKVKTHEVPPHGRIIALYPELDYGRIETPDGRDIYFHRNSVLEADFDTLETGMEVRFAEAPGDAGPKATTVHLIGKHHPTA